ncbi:hypothetical protein K2X92_02230 [Candidatus Gracilibacteria bacterium]|nr:hypothetical protein [Candidatus Gracilibacteria bacterium]
MGLKKYLNAMVFATAAFAGGTQAQSTPINTVTQNTATQTNNVLDPVKNKKTDPNIGKQFLVDKVRFSDKFGDVTLGVSGKYDAKFGAGASAEAIYGNESIAIAGLYTKLQDAQYGTVGLSKSIGEFNLTGTYSTGAQSANKALGNNEYTGNIKGAKKTLSMTVQNIGIFQDAGFKGTFENTDESTLKYESDITKEVSVQDLPQMTETKTRTYDNQTRTYWTGGTTKEVSLVAGLKINNQNSLNLSVGKKVMTVLQNTTSYTVGSIGYTHLQSSDRRFKFFTDLSGQSRKSGVEVSQLIDGGKGELIAGYSRNSYSNGVAPSNVLSLGFRYAAFGGKISGYTPSSSTGPRDARRSVQYATTNPANQVDPQSVGLVDIQRTKVLIKEVTTYTPKEILTTFGKVIVNANGTLTVEFETNASTTKKSLQAAPQAVSAVPNANISYSLKIKKPDGSTEIISITPPSWTSTVFESGAYGLTILTSNIVDGKKTETQSEEYKVTIEKDSKEDIGELELIQADYVSALLKYSAKDDNGIRNETWKFTEQNTAKIETNKEAKTILISQATPGSKLTVVFEGEYAVMGADGKLTWKPFKKTKEVTFMLANDSETILTKPEVTVTYNSISAKNMITDTNGVSGQYAELYDASGALVGARQNGVTYSWNNLNSNHNYKVKTFAYTIKILPNNSQESVLVDSERDVDTNIAGIDSPTTIVLEAKNITTNSILAACNIIDLDGVTGTCSISGGPGARSWNIGSDEPITGLEEDTQYTLRIVGTKVINNPDNTKTNVSIDETVVFKTKLTTDTTPTAFSFADQTGVALSTVVTSAPITIAGINTASPISVSGGEYSINGGAWTSTAGSVTNGQTVRVRGTSSASNSTSTSVTLTVGGVSDVFDITTEAVAPDTTPTAFSFADQTGVALSTVVTSAPITIAGINTASPISVSGGEYSINGGAWTSTAGSVTNGQTVRVRGTSSASNSTSTSVTLTVGGVSDVFDITTEAVLLPSCTTSMPVPGGSWATGTVGNINISSCTAGSTWTVEDITTGGPVVTWSSATSGSGDASPAYEVNPLTEGKTFKVRITVSKGGQTQVYELTAPNPIW